MAINVNPGDPHYPDGGHSAFEVAEVAVRAQPTYSHRPKPMTNADRIRAMSDEELAEGLEEWQDWGGGLSKELWLEWLKQPAEEVDKDA